MNFAVIQTGGKQYKVSPGQKIRIEKIEPKEKGNFVFDKILLIAEERGMDSRKDAEIKIGRPYLPDAAVHAQVLRQGRDKKKIIFRYHSKTRYRKKKGHRQPFTEVLIDKIKD